MSQWATLDARFVGLRGGDVTDGMPTGSESGPTVHERKGETWVEGRLRDVNDHDAPAALAWFLRFCQWCDEADFMWDLDNGPRYRYEWRDGELTKLRGVLD